ncbi:MAG: PIN domain-containing protein [Actinobacteria bacterium]|nr:PIN domain-containing protein [Actinomycetota bacterium]
MAVVDAGPLIAAANSADPSHRTSVEALARTDLRLVIPALIVAEATYAVGLLLGPRAEAAFLRGLEPFDVEAPEPGDWKRIGELVEHYADLRLGGADASAIVLAERLDARVVITLDRRHFSVVRPAHCEAFELLPA